MRPRSFTWQVVGCGAHAELIAGRSRGILIDTSHHHRLRLSLRLETGDVRRLTLLHSSHLVLALGLLSRVHTPVERRRCVISLFHGRVARER